MANVFKEVWIIDTAGSTILWQGPWRPKIVYWFNPTAAGDTFSMQDINGNVILEGRCETINVSQVFNLDNWYQNGLKVPTLVSGKLEIHLR